MVALMALATTGPRAASQESPLTQQYDLSRGRSPALQHYRMDVKIITRAGDGSRANVETYRMRLTGNPGDRTAAEADRWTCTRFAIRRGDGPEVTVPALEGWSYEFDRSVGIDEHGQVLGISHARFEGLTDDGGNALSPLVAYQVYNQFVQFHAYVDQIATPDVDGASGIQNLTRIGDRVVLDEPADEFPLDVGLIVREGSVYRPGEVTLEFKGLSVVHGEPSALLGIDGGEGSYSMAVDAMPNVTAETVGGTRFFGDVYVGLTSMWLRRADITVVDVTETSIGGRVVANTTIESHYSIRATRE